MILWAYVMPQLTVPLSLPLQVATFCTPNNSSRNLFRDESGDENYFHFQSTLDFGLILCVSYAVAPLPLSLFLPLSLSLCRFEKKKSLSMRSDALNK